MSPDEKGRELESAVHAIEAVILDSSPAMCNQPLKIETRKRVNVDGVHHEIDIFVTAKLAMGYTAIFIFECKNWEDAVGKNEIIVFSEKIDAVSAQKGYFVAKSFTKDAEAQALKDLRIKLLAATEHDPAAAITPDDFHYTARASIKVSTVFRAKESSRTHTDPMSIQHAKLHLHGRELFVIEYLNAWAEELYAERLLGFVTAYLPEGIYPMTASAERSFNAGECVINGKEMATVQLDAEFGVKIIRPAVIADYEVATRGRAIRLEQVKVHDFAIDTTFIKVHSE